MGVVEGPDKGILEAVVVVKGKVKADRDKRLCLRARIDCNGGRRTFAFVGSHERVCGLHREGKSGRASRNEGMPLNEFVRRRRRA